MSAQRHKTRLTALALMMTLIASCGELTAYETTKEVLRRVYGTLPTASSRDTEQTKREVGVHRVVVKALCDDLKAGCV